MLGEILRCPQNDVQRFVLPLACLSTPSQAALFAGLEDSFSNHAGPGLSSSVGSVVRTTRRVE